MKDYWICIAGPVEEEALPHGADFQPRMAVKDALDNMLGDNDCEHVYSGWGCNEETYQAIHAVWDSPKLVKMVLEAKKSQDERRINTPTP